MNTKPPDSAEPETRAPVKQLLDRWSDRLEKVREEEKNETGGGQRGKSPQSTSPDSSSYPEPVEDEADEKQLPSLESLTPESDYSPFFSEHVSESVRKLALRKLFSSPVFNVSDGLDDYDEDFKTFTGLGSLITEEMKFREQAGTPEDPKEVDEHSGQDHTVVENPGASPQVAESGEDTHTEDPVETTASATDAKPSPEPDSVNPADENTDEIPETSSSHTPRNYPIS